MKLNIQIEKQANGILEENHNIVEIDINNGNWKYIEPTREMEEKIPLTINNICKSHYLSLPVKDAYPHYDFDLYEETGEIQVEKATVRSYDSLLDYLNCRINNVKENYHKFCWTDKTLSIILFEEDFRYSDENRTIVSDMTYKKEGLCDVKITVVE